MHKLTHKRKSDREKFTCLIQDCYKIYINLSTLKQHIQQLHKGEYQQIETAYPGMAFSEVFKELSADRKKFSFIKEMPLRYSESG